MVSVILMIELLAYCPYMNGCVFMSQKQCRNHIHDESMLVFGIRRACFRMARECRLADAVDAFLEARTLRLS